MPDNKEPSSSIVEVHLYLENPASADRIAKAIQTFRTGWSTDSQDNSAFLFSEIKYDGLQPGNRYQLSFIGPGQDFAAVSDSVHEFLNAFIDAYCAEEWEEDWLCELDCDELPTIIKYEVMAARPLETAARPAGPRPEATQDISCGDCANFDRYRDADDGYGGCQANGDTVHEDYEVGDCPHFRPAACH